MVFTIGNPIGAVKAFGFTLDRSIESRDRPPTSCRTVASAIRGINFASQDYLGLAGHPNVVEAAIDALRCFGPHSAGSPTLLGNTALSLQLEREIGAALQMPEVVLFPTGWAAGFGAIAGLVRPYDHIVMDKLAHACLQQGAHAATKNVYRTEHRSVNSIREHLMNPQGG